MGCRDHQFCTDLLALPLGELSPKATERAVGSIMTEQTIETSTDHLALPLGELSAKLTERALSILYPFHRKVRNKLALTPVSGSGLYCILPSQSLSQCDNDSSPRGGAKWRVLNWKQPSQSLSQSDNDSSPGGRAKGFVQN